MLNVPKLDDLSFDQIFERARSRIPMCTDDWTDFNYHDPGVTTLQTFAWLMDALNYYIDATGEEHRLGYLGLLGIRPAWSPAGCNVAVTSGEREIAIARGAKLLAGGTVFETVESHYGAANKVQSLFIETGGEFSDLTPFAGVDGGYATLFTHAGERESTLYIGFERDLESDVRFYADVLPHAARNPFTDNFALSRLEWEYWDGGRWQRAELLEDGTCGFLRCGYISLAPDGKTKSLDGHPVLPKAHYLRARLVWNAYDALPKIGRIYPNCLPVIQMDTRAQALEAVFDGNPEMKIDYHIGINDVLCVAVGDGDGYSLWFEHVLDKDSLCEVAAGKYPWQRIVRFDRTRFGAFPEAGQTILVTVTDADSYGKLRLGVTSGFARERMALDLKNLCELRLALVEEKNGRSYYRLWDESGNLADASCDARAFELKRGTGEVIFGDGIAGLQPDAGRLVVAVTAKASLLGDGNVRAGQINRLLDEAYGGVSVHNPEDATGGKRLQTSAELEGEIEDKIYKPARAVTAEDYIAIVKATPGLMIDGASVISCREYGKYYPLKCGPNTVLVAVKPYSEDEAHPVLSEAYHRRIREHIEQYRLLTTDVRILPAKYVGVEVDGRIVLTENTPATRRRVEEKLSELVDFTRTKSFGAPVVSGRVFSHLEMLDCVIKVSQLFFSCMGEGGQKNEQGDIVVYPDALAYPCKINIEFVCEGGKP